MGEAHDPGQRLRVNVGVAVVGLESMAGEIRLSGEMTRANWLPDGRWIGSFVGPQDNLVIDSLDGSSARSMALPEAPEISAMQGHPDGSIVYAVRGADADLDTWLVDPEGDPQPFLDGPNDEGGVRFSPDGRYASFVSDRTGQFEVYVMTFPDRSTTWQVSTAGGSEAIWRGDGEEIVYRSGSDLVAVPVTTEPTFQAGTPTVLFRMPYDGVLGHPEMPNYDVAKDGSWFLMVNNTDLDEPAETLEIALGWSYLLETR